MKPLFVLYYVFLALFSALRYDQNIIRITAQKKREQTTQQEAETKEHKTISAIPHDKAIPLVPLSFFWLGRP